MKALSLAAATSVVLLLLTGTVEAANIPAVAAGPKPLQGPAIPPNAPPTLKNSRGKVAQLEKVNYIPRGYIVELESSAPSLASVITRTLKYTIISPSAASRTRLATSTTTPRLLWVCQSSLTVKMTTTRSFRLPVSRRFTVPRSTRSPLTSPRQSRASLSRLPPVKMALQLQKFRGAGGAVMSPPMQNRASPILSRHTS